MPVDGPERVPAAPAPRRGTGGQPGLLEPGAATDPCRLRLYRRLRDAYPLCYDEGLGAWLLSRYADVAVALTDPRFAGYPHDGAPRGDPAPLGLCRGSLRCTARDEGPRGPEFQPRPAGSEGAVHMVAPARRKAVERTAYVLARRIAGRQQADLVEEFCRWLPAGAAAAAAGLSSPDLDRLPRAALHPRLIHSAAGPTDCAGHTALRETALASFLANLLDDGDLLAAVRTEPGLIARAWTETLRHDPPVQIVLRRTLTEVPVSGGTLPAGVPVACLTGAAGRDPDRFTDPDRFDPLRPDPGRLITGPAGCPAVLLGGLEAEYGLRALLEAMPRIRWADGFRPVGTGLLTRGPRTLLVRPS
ncbi:cytochrome P450 [Streptomyces sp. BE147]|uniref:cytochrome P450 n=1 Tax=unclassified Streptomyces TaxID=2593676 RepID=UPI002E759A9C|nr:cytochrome P450 [Streptomyces sp. BE147]MEE1737705.1 cytochrome P450 [Streptomyces sp. BE147]